MISTDLQILCSGEQYRHLQNVRQSRSRVSIPRTHNTPTLPARFTTLEYESAIATGEPPPTASVPVSYSGPAPPKSWRPSLEQSDRKSIEWHTRALSLAAAHLGNFTETLRVPSLALLCLQMILASCTSKAVFRDAVVPYIPAHLRRDVIRYCAIHSPLPNWKLDALFNSQGNADGEILVMGPAATLPEEYFLRKMSVEESDSAPRPPETAASSLDWETEESTEEPLLSLILVSTHLPTTILLALPPSITRLALIDLPSPIPLHRLPKLCPMLVLLDLSYNKWLQAPAGEGAESLEKTAWSRWRKLEIVGLRGCYISSKLIQKINAGRWDDVDVITT